LNRLHIKICPASLILVLVGKIKLLLTWSSNRNCRLFILIYTKSHYWKIE